MIGIQLDRPFIRIALLKQDKGDIQIAFLKSALLSDMSDVKRFYMSRGLDKGTPQGVDSNREIVSEWQGPNQNKTINAIATSLNSDAFITSDITLPKSNVTIVSGLLTKDVFTRLVHIKISDSRHLKQALAFHSDATSYFNPSESIAVSHVVQKTTEETQALLLTTNKTVLASHLAELEKMEIYPDQVTTHPIALVHYIRWKEPQLENAFLIHLGANEWTSVAIEKGELKKAYSLSCGTEDLLHALWEDRKKSLVAKEVEGIAKQIDLLQLKSHLNPHLSKKINELRQELTKIVLSFYKTFGRCPLILTGSVDSFGNLSDFLQRDMKEIVTEDQFCLSIEEQKYAVAIGLALQAKRRGPQFLQGDFFPKKNWKKAGIYSMVLIASSFLLTSSLLYLGQSAISSKKTSMIQLLEKQLDALDSRLKEAIFHERASQELILQNWLDTIAKYNKEYPYILQAPKVYEVLSWLSHHPFLLDAQADGNPLIIRDIHYQLLQCPHVNAPREIYQAKIELEFSTSSPLNARKFHEVLLNDQIWVDLNSGVNWEVLHDERYRASFLLKNKAPYVP